MNSFLNTFKPLARPIPLASLAMIFFGVFLVNRALVHWALGSLDCATTALLKPSSAEFYLQIFLGAAAFFTGCTILLFDAKASKAD